MRKQLNNTTDTTNTYSVCFKIMTDKIHKKKYFKSRVYAQYQRKWLCAFIEKCIEMCVSFTFHITEIVCLGEKKPTPIENKIHQYQRIHPIAHTQIHTHKVIHHAHTDALSPVI